MGRITYTQGPGQWGQLISQYNSDTGQSHYYAFDHTSNTRFLSNSSGSVTDSYSYKAFGEPVTSSGSAPNPMRYGGEVGYYRDKIERVYVRARHYEPPTGQWLSRDPIGSAGGDLNLYRFVGNNPLNVIDPSGEASINCPGNIPVHSVIRRWCKEFRTRLTPINIAAIHRCYKTARPICVPYFGNFNRARANCFVNSCNTMTIACRDGSTDCGCSKDRPGGSACAIAIGRTPSCKITLCLNNMVYPNCTDQGGDRSIPILDFNLVHEMSHCCKVDHGLPAPDSHGPFYECADVLACCIIHVLRPPRERPKLKAPMKIPCERHDPWG